MTTYRSEADFDERFGRTREPDGTPSIVSYLEYQGRKLVDRFDRDTYRALAGSMDRHDIGRGRDGIPAALATLAAANVRLHGVGIGGDILYGPGQVEALLEAAREVGVETAYREINSNKGHDAFLVEWDQMAQVIGELVA
jgi:homoserine O-acetyltransferase